ncbi:MAG TPA: N-acetyl-gamma-glutamyl-phosphate reductase, partial [Clostridia bacterium]
MIRVGIYGASGYMGGEAARILIEHPDVKIAWLTSRGDKPIEFFHKNLCGSGLKFIKPEEVTPCDVVFAALPSGQVMKEARKLLESGTKVIDLGADFRLKDKNEWESVYGKTHSDWELAAEAVYGIPELHRKEIKSARVIANPGCFSSAAILGLAPLVKHGLIDNDKIIVDGL